MNACLSDFRVVNPTLRMELYPLSAVTNSQQSVKLKNKDGGKRNKTIQQRIKRICATSCIEVNPAATVG